MATDMSKSRQSQNGPNQEAKAPCHGPDHSLGRQQSQEFLCECL